MDFGMFYVRLIYDVIATGLAWNKMSSVRWY